MTPDTRRARQSERPGQPLVGPVDRHGVIAERAERPRLDSQTETTIARGTDELYAKASGFFLRP